MNKILNGLLATVLATSAQAEFMTGNELLQYADSNDDMKWGIAMGYVLGAADSSMGDTHCTPENVTAGQVMQIVVDKLRENPKHRHHSADIFVSAALATTWPCKKGTGA